ncbi:hypothetical protein IEQ34_007406 [Dendrobium chrysotoxum]|uniref:RNA helicase n=1 Tax=Dendrobium chrysotoxum TaxID=161865 RepID=A0AAV7H976_DENCH|nr:hypothetical protein IEQ34_007406 [Dendrobium chrysotoxum]
MANPCNQKEQVEADEDLSFEELGLDPRLLRALSKKSITKPTPIQREAIPLILEKTIINRRAKMLLHGQRPARKLFSESGGPRKSGPSAFILLPTRELCGQVHSEASSLLDLCRVQLKVVQLLSDMSTVALSGPPELIVSTPACISTCLSKGIIQVSCIKDSLYMLILDEADLLLSHGYEDDLKNLVPHVPRRCQCLLMSATSSSDIEKLKKLVLHNPVILTLADANHLNNEIIPKNVQQFLISCSAHDKLLYMLALLKLELVQKKVLIFVNSIDTGFRLKLFLEQFGIKSAVLNAELPQNSRSHILEEFNAGLFDYLIATDDNKERVQNSKDKQTKSKGSNKHFRRRLDAEFGVVRGIDFKNVFTVINFDMPHSPEGYVHRVGRTGRAYNTGASVSLVSPEENKIIEKVKLTLGDSGDMDISSHITPFPLLTTNAVESLRYRAEDVVKSVTRFAVRESRAQDLRNEILNSEKLKAHFEENPRDLDLLKHDKLLSKHAPPAHLRDVPEYLLDPTTQEASKTVKLSRAAMGIENHKRRTAFNKGFRKSKDPLKTFTAEGRKSHKLKNRQNDKEGGNRSNKRQRKSIHCFVRVRCLRIARVKKKKRITEHNPSFCIALLILKIMDIILVVLSIWNYCQLMKWLSHTKLSRQSFPDSENSVLVPQGANERPSWILATKFGRDIMLHIDFKFKAKQKIKFVHRCIFTFHHIFKTTKFSYVVQIIYIYIYIFQVEFIFLWQNF